MQLFGLADCNNFYCSCERVFQPTNLWEKPVVVLSNNDGCVVALSTEAKALGIKRGDVFYQIKDKVEAYKVAVFSSNYNLYGDMSRRVMSLLSHYTPRLDVYSIDEAFLDFSNRADVADLHAYGVDIVRTVKRSTGIPVSLGIAPTKTLAKMASKFAKQYKGYQGCCLIDSEDKRLKALRLYPIEDVWGIGRQYGKRMRAAGVDTAYDFTQKGEAWVRAELKTVGWRTWRELRGESCISIDELPHKQSICTSRSFPDRGRQDIKPLVADFAAACVRKLRQQRCCAGSITLFAATSRFNDTVPSHHFYETFHFPVATSDVQEVVSTAVKMVEINHKEGDYWYKNAGVILWNICRRGEVQGNLFDTRDREKMERLMATLDEINRKNGHDFVRLAVQEQFELKAAYKSRQYTTNIKEIIEVKAE